MDNKEWMVFQQFGSISWGLLAKIQVGIQRPFTKSKAKIFATDGKLAPSVRRTLARALCLVFVNDTLAFLSLLSRFLFLHFVYSFSPDSIPLC